MHNKKSTVKKPSQAASAKKLHVCDELGNAALIGGNAMASSELFGPVVGAVTGMAEEAMAMLGKQTPDGVRRNARAKKPKRINSAASDGEVL